MSDAVDLMKARGGHGRRHAVEKQLGRGVRLAHDSNMRNGCMGYPSLSGSLSHDRFLRLAFLCAKDCHDGKWQKN
jgi:hypothetical protein